MSSVGVSIRIRAEEFVALPVNDQAQMREEVPSIAPLALPSRRFHVYVDGYNFYKSINFSDPPWLLRLGWCNLQRLGELLVENSFESIGACDVVVKYFTTRLDQRQPGHRGEYERQQLWMGALEDHAPNLVWRYGLFVQRTEVWEKPGPGLRPERLYRNVLEEKKTDVNIAIEAANDLDRGGVSGMVLVSGDTDFQPLVENVAGRRVPIAVYNPHGHDMYKLSPDAPSSLIRLTHLSQKQVAQCHLPYDKTWIQYLDSKVKHFPAFEPCRAYERQQGARRA